MRKVSASWKRQGSWKGQPEMRLLLQQLQQQKALFDHLPFVVAASNSAAALLCAAAAALLRTALLR